MITKFIEAHDATKFNWGKFMVCRFTNDEWFYRSAVAADDGRHQRLLFGRGWTLAHLLVLDLQTGEGAIFMPGGLATADLNRKHKIWVCPLFEPFLTWLYTQDTHDLDALPNVVNLGDVPVSMHGYRRKGADIKE